MILRITNLKSLGWTKTLKKINARNRAKKKAQQSSLNSDWEKYKEAKNKVRYEITIAEENFLSNIANASSPKLFWNYVNNSKNEKAPIPILTDKLGNHY